MVTLGQVASILLSQGPFSIRTENSQLAVYVYIDVQGRDIGSYVADAQRAIAGQVQLPKASQLVWSGEFDYLERAKARLTIVIPVTAALIFLLPYLHFRRLSETDRKSLGEGKSGSVRLNFGWSRF